jgi:hypothetical protein
MLFEVFFTSNSLSFNVQFIVSLGRRGEEHPRRAFGDRPDRCEPVHVHVESDGKIAKFWLDPIRLQGSGGFHRAQIARIRKVIYENHRVLTEAWDEYFND